MVKKVLSSMNSFPTYQWTSDTVLFSVTEETQGKIQLGVQSVNEGSGSNARLFFDDVELLYVDHVLNNDATLSNITLSSGVLTPSFNHLVKSYTVVVPSNVESITVTPVQNDENAKVQGGGEVNVSAGDVSINIQVTAEDGFTKNTYSITFSTSQNLISNWDGNGATGAGSEPNNFGWDCSPTTSGWTEANVFGIRYQDGVTNSYNGQNLTNRVLYLRWDGLGGTSTGSTFSFPLPVNSCKAYQLKGKIAWTANATSPSFNIGVNSVKDNSGTMYSSQVVQVSQTSTLHDFNLVFIPTEEGQTYLTIGASSAVLAAITDLELIEYTGEPFVYSSLDEMVFDSTNLSQTFMLYSYGLTNSITFDAPEGLMLSPATISNTEAECGIEVTATFDSAESLESGTLNVLSDAGTNAITITEILPAYMAPGSYELSSDGTWCWFQDPRAISFEGEKNQTYTGWITSNGKVQAASFNHRTGEILTNTISPDDFMQVDDHNNPTFLIRNDGKILVSYSGHFYGPMRVAVSENTEDITSFGEEAHFGSDVTYANPYQMGDSIVMFYRDGVTWASYH